MKASVNYEPLTPLNFLKRTTFVFPDKPAVVYGNKEFTYRELSGRVTRLANALKNAGITKGDRVAFLAPNIPPLLEAHYGVPLAGGILVAINVRLAAKEVEYILNHSQAKILVVDKGFAHLIDPIVNNLECLEKTVLIDDGEQQGQLQGQDYEDFLAAASDQELPIPVQDETEPISINYTSGTTGRPKGVMYSHRGTYLNALDELLEAGMNSDSKYLWTLPMFHCNGWCFTWAVTAIGGTHVCLRKVDPDLIYDIIADKQITHLCAAPTVLVSMAAHPKGKELNLDYTLKVVTAGAPPAPTVIMNMEQVGAEVIHVYGLTEVYGPHSVCKWQPKWEELENLEKAKIKSRQGVPFINAGFMRVVDDEMNDIPMDGQTLGEVVMRGNNVMVGYFQQSEDTEQAFRGGWFHSGDVAVMHPDGYIEIKDRKKDVIISGGENISTVEVENVIYQHPEVLECAVVAKPHEKWGEVPKAFVALKETAACNEEDIINFCKEHIAKYKCPKEIEFGPLPKTATGKILKYKLREKEWAGKEKRVN